jgi:hypothetical protein
MKKMLVILVAFLLATAASSQVTGDYRSTGTVSLTAATNWETYAAGSWIAATIAPNTATLVAGNTITIQAAHTWNNGSNAAIPAGVILLFQGVSGTYTANTLTINGTYIHASGALVSTVFTAISTTTGLGINSTVIYRASANYAVPTAALGGRTYNNLTFDTDGTTVAQPSFSTPGFTSPVTVNGTLLVDTWKADFYTAANTTALNLNGDVTLTGSNTYLRIRSATIATGKTLTINATDSLGIGNAFALTVNGALINKSSKPIAFSTGATMIVNGTYQHDVNGGTMPNTTTTYNTGSTILVTGITNAATVPVLPAITGNVLWNCPAQTSSNTFVNTTSNSTTVNGNLTIQSTGTANIYLGGAGTGRTLTVNGNLIINGGKFGVIKPATGAAGNQTCTVNGDVIVSSGDCYIADALTGATAYTGKGYLSITGSLNHTGGSFGSGATTVAGTGVLSFTTNNTDKTIGTTGISGATSIVIDKTATGTITLNTSTALPITASLTFTTGKLAIAANAVLEASNISGASSTSYISTLSNGANTGALKMSGISVATIFPIGSSNNYMPVTVTPVTASDFSVGVFEGVTTNGASNGTAVSAARKQTIVDAVWLINRTSSNTDNAAITLSWPASLEGSGFAALNNNIGLARYSTDWGTFAGTGDNTLNTATNTYNAFSPFTVGQIGTTLPIIFSSINAVVANKKINIEWKVENEINLNKYQVEKSNDGISFNELETINAKGLTTYTSIDNNPFASNNYYRIKAIDKSGDAKYSSIVRVSTAVKGKNELSVYPNPVINKTINLQLKDLDADNYSLLLVNNVGQVVYTKALGNLNGTQSMVLPLQQTIVAGTYQLIVKATNQQLKQTVIIQ